MRYHGLVMKFVSHGSFKLQFFFNEIKALMSSIHVRFCLEVQSANGLADSLAKMGIVVLIELFLGKCSCSFSFLVYVSYTLFMLFSSFRDNLSVTFSKKKKNSCVPFFFFFKFFTFKL